MKAVTEMAVYREVAQQGLLPGVMLVCLPAVQGNGNCFAICYFWQNSFQVP